MPSAGKARPVAVQDAEVPTTEAATAKAKAKKLPRYVKEALKEVEQEKASRLLLHRNRQR